MTLYRKSDGSIWIKHAPEHMWVDEQFLDERNPFAPEVTYGDGILTIRAENMTVSYGIVRVDPFTRRAIMTRCPTELPAS